MYRYIILMCPYSGVPEDPVHYTVDRRWIAAVLCLGWLNVFDSEMEVEAAKGLPYRRPMLRVVRLYASCGRGGLQCIVLYRRRSLNFQNPVSVKPLVALPSLWVYHLHLFDTEKKGRLEI